MGYPITENLLTNKDNRPYLRAQSAAYVLKPQGIVIHATATPGATDQREREYFNSADRDASAHYFADWDSITRCIPENEVAFHAGTTANSMYLSIEMCEPAEYDQNKFSEVWNRTVWYVADCCVRYGWSTGPNVWSHRGISARYPKETDHQDPIAFLARYGKTWDDMIKAIDAKIAELKNPIPAPIVTPIIPPAPVVDTEKEALKAENQQLRAEITNLRARLLDIKNRATI